MRTRNFTFRVPQPLWECLPPRVKQLGMEAISAYLLSLLRYDLLICKPHHATGDFHQLPQAEQDRIDDEIARAFAAGESLGGTWFEARIRQAAMDASLPDPPELSRVAEKLKKRLKSRKTTPPPAKEE